LATMLLLSAAPVARAQNPSCVWSVMNKAEPEGLNIWWFDGNDSVCLAHYGGQNTIDYDTCT
jgi:hypothetical protein